MKTTKIFGALLVTVCLVLFTSCESKIKGDGNIITEEFAIDAYNELKIEGSVNVIYEAKPADPTYLRIETDANIMQELKVESKKNILVIAPRKKINPTRGVNVYTNSPSLKYVESKGSSDIHLQGAVAGDEFKLDQLGSGDFIADNLVFNVADFNLKGSGEMTMSGQVNKSKVDIAGNGDVKAFGLVVGSLDCIISGNGNVEVNVQQQLSIDIRGNGNIIYKGNPQITKQEIKGSGTVKMQ